MPSTNDMETSVALSVLAAHPKLGISRRNMSIEMLSARVYMRISLFFI